MAVVHLGAARLRASQCVLCLDGLVEREWRADAPRNRLPHPIPRVVFTLRCGLQSLASVAQYVHHFIVEVLWLEQRRDTPRHHVRIEWLDVEAGGTPRSASLAALTVEHVRTDAGLRAERAARGIGAAATSLSYAGVWEKMLCANLKDVVNRGIRLAAVVDCSTTTLLRHNTARVVQWQLAWLSICSESR